jgi:HEAT repeat protein
MGHRSSLFWVVFLVLGLADAAWSDKRSFEDQLANLRSPRAGTRIHAARSLGEMGRKEAIRPLSDAVSDPEEKVRLAVVQALRKFKDPATVPPLLRAATDSVVRTRQEALAGLLEVYVDAGESRTVDYLLSFFRNEEEFPAEVVPFTPVDPLVVEQLERSLQDAAAAVRQQAASGLGLLRAESAVDGLGVALADPDKGVRARATEALGSIGSERAGQALLAAVSDPSRAVRTEAIEALGRMGYRPAAPALLALHESQRGTEQGDKILSALARMGAPEARNLFLEVMTSPQPKQRRWAAEGLGRLGDARLAPSLTKDFLREPDPTVQLAYCFSLVYLGRTEFVDRLVLSLGSLALRGQSRGYLVELGGRVLGELYGYLSDPVPAVRRELVTVLMRVGDPSAIPHLRPLLSDPNAEVVDRVNRAIARLERVQVASAKQSP